MRSILYAALGACFLLLSGTAAKAYSAAELLRACTEADNDARWGEVAELECEQYILGFVHALQEVHDSSVCAPRLNTADEVRWAFMRWVHEDYGAHKAMAAGAALLATLRENFKCE